jgi:hypothetical protein
LAFVLHGRWKNAFNEWKADTFTKFAQERERKIAKVIDEFIAQSMSPFRKYFLRWAQKNRDANKREFAAQIKAGFSLTSLMTRYLRQNKEKYLGYAFRRIGYDPGKVMLSASQKMLRAAGANIGTAFLAWKMWVLSGDRMKMKLQKRNLAAKNIGDVIEKKRKRHLRSVIRPLASGVA